MRMTISAWNKEAKVIKQKCNAMRIDAPELDTVLICRDLRMTMEAIMTRDQRTTSHRVLDVRGGHVNVTSGISTSYQKLIGASGESVKTARKLEATARTTSKTSSRPSCDDEFTDSTSTRKHKTEIEERFLRCDVCTVRCNCRNTASIRRHDRRGCYENNVDRRATTIPHKKHSTTWLRLGSLLVTLLVVSVQGAPTTMTLEDRRLSSPPKWVNPCGLAADDINSDDFIQISDPQLLAQVVLQAKNALDHAQLFRDDYIKRTFNTDFADLHTTWKDNHYDWLPGPKEIPKQLGEPLAQEYLAKLEVRMLDTALLDAYEYMQRYAVGLEQIVWDQDDHRLEFRSQFKDTEFQLRTVLCELQEALVERGVTLRPDVTRDAMTSQYRAMSSMATYRNLRDWLIFRDYMNGLEYVVQVFQHLLDALKS